MTGFESLREKLGCRRWNLSLVTVIVITFSNMLLTMLLLQSEQCESIYPAAAAAAKDAQQNSFSVTKWNAEPIQDPEIPRPCEPREEQASPDTPVLKMDVRLGKWDARRLYKTFDSVAVGSEYPTVSESHMVCLATQSSIEKLHSLVQVAHYWTGPISVAVFTPGDEEFQVMEKYIVYLRSCYAPIRERVTFSFQIPKSRLVRVQPSLTEFTDEEDCLKPEATLNKYVSQLSKEQASWKTKNVYPQNHLRNLARRNCQTEYVFLTDVDVIPCIHFTESLNEFLKDAKCEKCIYVIPTFELDTRVRFPQNKTELLRLSKKGLARPFHEKVFINNQYATNFTRWAADVPKNPDPNNPEKTHISYDITASYELYYEPFYVARDSVPAHDERFMGYGFTRNTQVYESFVAGWQFMVLSPIFAGHWGLQTRKGRPAWREHQNNYNRKLFDGFKKEIYARYGRDPLKLMKHGK